MEYITLTSDIRKYFGITSCHICIDDNDIIVMLQEMSDTNLIISCSYMQLKKGQKILVIFPTLFGKCEINAKITDIKEESFLIIECEIISRNQNEFFIEFQNYIINIINQKKRKEERILCNEKNLEKLRLDGIIMLTYKYRNFRGVIKDISYSGIKVLTNPLLMQVRDETFSFSIKFKNPEEKFYFIKCPIVRKQTFEFEKYNFAEIVFKLGDNINFRKRLDNYFNEENRKIKR